MIDEKKYEGTGTIRGLHVEVRFRDALSPQACRDITGDVIVSKDWTRLPVTPVDSPLAVRNDLWEYEWYPHAFSRRLLTCEAAHAIAAQFAALNRKWSFMMQFRFVEEKIEYNWSHSEVRESEPFSFSKGLVAWAGAELAEKGKQDGI